MEGVVVDILRTPELQRLRRIRQLGLAHLVFPGRLASLAGRGLGDGELAGFGLASLAGPGIWMDFRPLPLGSFARRWKFSGRRNRLHHWCVCAL